MNELMLIENPNPFYKSYKSFYNSNKIYVIFGTAIVILILYKLSKKN